LNPLDGHLVLGAIVLSIIDRELSTLSETVDTSAPVDEELKLLFDFVSDRLEHILSELLGVIRNLRLKFDGVFIDALDILLVEVDLEVVGVQLELLAWCLCISDWLLWE
jgi:hypothetical protein